MRSRGPPPSGSCSPAGGAMRGSSRGHGWLGTWLRVLLAALMVASAGASTPLD